MGKENFGQGLPGIYRNNGEGSEKSGPEIFKYEEWYILCNPERIYNNCELLVDIMGFKKGEIIPCIWVSGGYYPPEPTDDTPCFIFFSVKDADWDKGYLGRIDIESIPVVREHILEGITNDK